MKPKKIIQLNQITREYQLDGVVVPALKDINLEINEGDFLAIVGPSGSGKSTLLHILGLLDRHSRGDFLFLNKNISLLTDDQLADLRNRAIGFVFQQFNLLPRTGALENVLLPTLYGDNNPEEARQRAVRLLEDLGLGKKLNNYSNQLSGGQQQRVAVARALINRPKIIFADEPTGNLDTQSGKEVFSILKNLNLEGKTIILVTHDSDLARQTSRQVYLQDGKITKIN
ncbi:MAG: ABC transporter ATP-binding protein [Candidatus Pacebacteria bacterium]|nr:ABC transporter ATP-binding protein [Candidatus Paceibacterota bacterium]